MFILNKKTTILVIVSTHFYFTIFSYLSQQKTSKISLIFNAIHPKKTVNKILKIVQNEQTEPQRRTNLYEALLKSIKS